MIGGAAGGVGVIAAQFARARGAAVVGTSSPSHFANLASLGVTSVAYGDGLRDRLRDAAPAGIDAYINTYGDGDVDLALALGVNPNRIVTVRAARAAARHGTHFAAQADGSSPRVWESLAADIVRGDVRIPIERTYPVDQIREAYADVVTRHGVGKRVLRFQ